jgi:arylsulfatase A-like enzyme
MPARREIHTGRYNFLHRSWGPIEPFDDSMPEILRRNGVYTHLVSDHLHYWEDGGATYHTRYSSFEIIRGMAGDHWKAEIKDPEIPPTVTQGGPDWRQDWINRKYMQEEKDHPQAKTFEKGIEFIETNHNEDNWFLQIETFDPHEPFFTHKKYKDLYEHDYDGPHFDWPRYGVVKETPEEVHHIRYEYAASVSMCDEYLGKILDLMDKLDLWKDTMLIVNTDHGFLLGEKEWFGKMMMPIFNENAHTPFIIWDPRSGRKNERRKSLVQTIDIAPTLLEYFGVEIPKDMQGRPLKGVIASDSPVREAGLFGTHGCHINITDGRYVYMRSSIDHKNSPLNEYTLMPTHTWNLFSVRELQNIGLGEPFSFTKGCKTMKIPVDYTYNASYKYGSILFDLENDPMQEHPITDSEIERRMIQLLVQLMNESDAPIEQYERLGLPQNLDGKNIEDYLVLKEVRDGSEDKIGNSEVIWRKKGKSMYYGLISLIWNPLKRQIILGLEQEILKRNLKELDEKTVSEIFLKVIPDRFKGYIIYMIELIIRKGK